jgi:hypothetical protein
MAKEVVYSPDGRWRVIGGGSSEGHDATVMELFAASN